MACKIKESFRSRMKKDSMRGGRRDSTVPVKKKLVIVGDGECGKTSLLIVFAKDEFPELYVPTIFETYTVEIQMGGQRVDLQLNDTAGQEDYDRLRPVSYPNTDVFLLCFSLDDAENVRNVREKWQPELRDFCPDVPVVLVGTKSDLRHNTAAGNGVVDGDVTPTRRARRQITPEEGECLAREIGAVGYLECSAKRRENVQDVFALAASAALTHDETQSRRHPSSPTPSSKSSRSSKSPSRSNSSVNSSKTGRVSAGGLSEALDSAGRPLSKLCGDLSDNFKSLATAQQRKKKCSPKCAIL